MKKILFLIFTLIYLPLSAQKVQWAYKVLDFSSQHNNKESSAKQVLGIPNAYPDGLSHFNAWQSKDNGKEQFIKVGFLTPIKPKQIVIVESFHPGTIKQIFAYDADGKEFEILNYTNTAVASKSRLLLVKTTSLDFFVLAVKIVLNTDKGIGEIDAIGMTTSDKPVILNTNTSDFMKIAMVPTRLDSMVNSKYPEMGPLISPDGKTLYFSRRDDPSDVGGKRDLEDIWYSTWDEKTNAWGEAKNIGAPLNNEEPNFINSISPDGNTILLGNSYLPDGDMSDGVSTSTKTATGWSTPVRLAIEDDEKNVSKNANYFMSNSQKILLISNDRKGDSFGDRDLYVSFPKPENKWTKPLNLGNVINTNGTEAAPFLAADDKTLYFTSDGLEGYGGSDIFMSRRLDDTWLKWSTPENLGPIVNTSYDESYLTLNAAGDRVYYTSERDDDKDVDIYMLELPKLLRPLPVMLLSGHVFNSKTNAEIPGARIFFENLSTGEEVGLASSNYTNGSFQIVLPSGNKYGCLAEKEGFISVHANVDLTKMKEYEGFHKDLYLTPIEAGQTIALNNVFFDFDKAILKKESFPELNRVAGLLKARPTMKIEISANTDSIGTEKYNDKLSMQRAEAVYNYILTKSGVDKNRIVAKHFGELKPAASNATSKGRALNRRVEFKILQK
jgi:OmpA-OmpF porin, OOP family